MTWEATHLGIRQRLTARITGSSPTRASDSVTMGLTGNDGRASFSLGDIFILAAHAPGEATARLDDYIATIEKTALPRIAEMTREALPDAPSDIASAARALLVWLARARDFDASRVPRSPSLGGSCPSKSAIGSTASRSIAPLW